MNECAACRARDCLNCRVLKCSHAHSYPESSYDIESEPEEPGVYESRRFPVSEFAGFYPYILRQDGRWSCGDVDTVGFDTYWLPLRKMSSWEEHRWRVWSEASSE